MKKLSADLGAAYRLRMFAIELPGCKRNLPMVVCHLVGHGRTYGGYGCSANLLSSVDRAVSEALQALAVDISGSREDLDARRVNAGAVSHESDTAAPVAIEELRKRVWDVTATSLQEEFGMAVDWVHRFGFANVCVANLTRVGVDIPVVKVLVPGLPCKMEVREASLGENPFATRVASRFSIGDETP
ncbi:YcaO-like family protein [Endomicrobium sp. AH-315-J14]|nr:YcaO-like family protein [Endomicrobium sp. AH-315-J14]